MSSLVSEIASAIREKQPLPKMPDALTLEEGYAIQRELVETLADGPLAGIKAGMTAPGPQKLFGLTHPLVGSLYRWGRRESGTSFESKPGVSLECEIGLIVDEQGNPKSAGPVIEVPYLAWSSPDDAKGSNVTAINVGADRYIVGEFSTLRDDYEALSVTLTRDRETLCEASLSDALGGPRKALSWMLEESTKRGLDIADGMLLITGACGGIHPAEPGLHVADYGELGSIEFTVT